MRENGQNLGGEYDALSNGSSSVEQSPLRDWRYKFEAPGFTQEEEAAVLECLRSGRASAGRYVHDFEQAFASLHGVKHAIAVANGTAAVHLALLAAKIGQSSKDELIQPSLNSVGAANMTVAVGAKPVFADIVSLAEPTIDPEDVARQIGPNTRAVLAMHYGGYPARMEALEALCQAHELLLIEQVCYGPGIPLAELGNRPQGSIGTIGCFSLGGATDVVGGEGGMILTNDHEIAARVRALLWQGRTTLSPGRRSPQSGLSDVKAHGFSYQMDDVRAALGLAQLNGFAAAAATRQKRAQAYANVVETFCDGAIEYVFGWAPADGGANVSAILVEPTLRDGLRAFLTEKRIETGLHYPPVHTFSAFSKCRASKLKLSNGFADRVVKLPISAELPVMAPEHIIRLCSMYLAGKANPQSGKAENRLQVA